MPLSIDLRERVIAAVNRGMRVTEVAKTFKVCRRVIYNWLALLNTSNNLAPKSGYQKGHSHKIQDLSQFRGFVELNKDCTIKEMRVAWQKLANVSVSKTSMQRALKKINYTSKKKHLTILKPMKKNVKIF
jgi:transposase